MRRRGVKQPAAGTDDAVPGEPAPQVPSSSSSKGARPGAAADADVSASPRSPMFVRLGTLKEAMLSRGESAPQFVYHGVLSGYRLHNLTFTQSLRSLFVWHNETMNVWTHLAGFLLFGCLIVYTALMAGGAADVRLPAPLRACMDSPERAACVRNLTLSTVSHEQLVRASRVLAAPASLPMHALEATVAETLRALNASAHGAADLRRRAVHQLASVRLPTFNVSLPGWLSEGAAAAAHAAVGAPSPPSAHAEAEPRRRRGRKRDASSPPPSARPPPPPGRLGALVARARRLASPRAIANVTASAAGGLFDLTAGQLSHGVDLASDLTHHAAEAGGALLNRTLGLTGLQLSALVAALPHVPELATMQREANALLHSLSDAAIPPSLERWPIYFFLASAMVCLLGSAVYHLFGTANARWTGTLGTLDFVGITALIVGSFVPILYYGFYNETLYRTLYIGAMCALGGVLLVLAVTPLFHDERYRALRTFLFTGLGLSGVVPITHMLFHHDFNQLSVSVLCGTALTGGAYLFGTVFYLSRFPEVVAPGKFDFILSSHNIWHVMVVIAACVHYSFVLELWHEAQVAHAEHVVAKGL